MLNFFRLTGDIVHLITLIGLLLYIWKKGSCTGISGRTQILLCLVFTTRYIDLFMYFISMYNSLMKVLYIAATYITVLSIYFKFRETYNAQHDTFRSEILVIGAGVIAVFVNYTFSISEILWAFSEYLEAVAIIPQLYLISKAGKSEKVVSFYIFGLTCYRALYVVNWVYRYYYENTYDLISIVPGVIQTLIYFDYFFAVLSSKIISKDQKKNKQEKYSIFVLSNDTVPLVDDPKKCNPIIKV